MEYAAYFAQGMGCIANLDSSAFHKYLEETQNTICGRHPIAILLIVSSLKVVGGNKIE